MVRPEDRCNPKFREDFIQNEQRTRVFATPRRRLINLFEKLLMPNHTETWLHLHASRWNLQPLFALFTFGTLLGIVGNYVNHKLYSIEPAWVKDYGSDYPAKRLLWISRFAYYHQIASYHFQMYRLQYFVNDQEIDPLNS